MFRIRPTVAIVASVCLAATSLLTTQASAAPTLVSAEAISATLSRDAAIPGTAWHTTPDGSVLVSYDDTVTGAKMDKLAQTTRQFGSRIKLEKMPGTLTRLKSGGQSIYGGGYRCSLGFNVRNSAGTGFFITAGHCTNLSSRWYANSSQTTLMGTRYGTSFPGNDYGIVQYASSYTNRPGNVYLYGSGTQDITSAGNASLNQSVRRSGSTTGVHSGRVTGLNATVNYPEGTVTGMIRTNICAEGGDSGGSLFAGTTALGLTSGGSGNCTSGGTTFYQPVPEVLSRYGVNVY